MTLLGLLSVLQVRNTAVTVYVYEPLGTEVSVQVNVPVGI